MNNAAYGKNMENLGKRIELRFVSKKKVYLKRTSKLSYMSQKTFDNDLATTCKSKFTSKFNKSVYVGMCILNLSKGLMHR